MGNHVPTLRIVFSRCIYSSCCCGERNYDTRTGDRTTHLDNDSSDDMNYIPSKSRIAINCSCFHSNNYIDEEDNPQKRKGLLRSKK
jgi:hypothetical protein